MRVARPAESDALAGALAQNQLQRMSFAHGALGNRSSAIAGNRLSRLGLGYNLAGNAANNRQSRAGLLAQITGGAANNRLGRQGLGADLLAQRSAELTNQGAGAAQLFGTMLDYNMSQDELAREQNRGVLQYAPGATNVPGVRSPQYPNVGGQPSRTGTLRSNWSMSRKPVSPMLKMNPQAGSGGMRSMLGTGRAPATLKLPGGL